MLECVINVSEGRDVGVLHTLATRCRKALLDVHIDPDHNRSVFTLAGNDVKEAVRGLISASFENLDLRRHVGVHPRIGIVDVVPFVDLSEVAAQENSARAARDETANWIAQTWQVPVFLYGEERTLPAIRRHAFTDLKPDLGPSEPHPTAGAVAVGHREPMVAYNVWLSSADKDRASDIANEIRSQYVRALALRVGNTRQVSMNLLRPAEIGPQQVFDFISSRARIERCELVGLMPEDALEQIGPEYWEDLDVDADRTIENRLAALIFANANTNPGANANANNE